MHTRLSQVGLGSQSVVSLPGTSYPSVRETYSVMVCSHLCVFLLKDCLLWAVNAIGVEIYRLGATLAGFLTLTHNAQHRGGAREVVAGGLEGWRDTDQRTWTCSVRGSGQHGYWIPVESTALGSMIEMSR